MQLEEDLERLNQYQKEAVLDDSNACIVNANVGSGKTTVLISKIMYLHHVKKVPYQNMVVLTFTNKAANEIKERLSGSAVGLDMEELGTFGTFHSVALYLLRNRLPIENLGYTRGFLVIEPEEELDIAMQVIEEEKLVIKYKNRLKKRLEQAVAGQLTENNSRIQDDIFKLVRLLREEKVKQNKMSFSDLLENTNQLLETDGMDVKWMIIDEVQDCDKMQLDFMERMMKGDTRLFAVGDPNQIVYSWRGSTWNVFYVLKDKYQAKELSLPINYRSSSSILEVAKCFLQNGTPLQGIRDTGNKIILKNHYNPFNEACYLADKIRELQAEGVPLKEIAVFYRLQSQSEVMEKVFGENGIPYEVSMKKTIQDIPVLKWMVKLLRFCVNPEDILSAFYVLNNRDYGERLSKKQAWKVIKHQDSDLLCKSKLYASMKGFADQINVIHNPEDLYRYFEMDEYLMPTSSSFSEDKKYVLDLAEILFTYIREKQMPFMEGLMDYLNSSALYGVNILQKDIRSETESVKLMTLHASKGLEFSHVFITGVNYGLIPLHTKDFEEEDEERRLFFVGITRAKDYLELSYYTNPDYYRVIPGASRYIQMIPTHLIRQDAGEKTEVNLQELKRQIQQAKKEGMPASLSNEESEEQKAQDMVRHKKYGIGKILKEDDLIIEVEFENYGVKEFMKAFSELESL
ncbi:ATP-dependent helicase [Robinsoniella peoriensis]